MTRIIFQFAATAFFAIAAMAPSLAENQRAQRNVFVSSGRETRIASYGAPDEKCEFRSDPYVQIVEWPSYGTLADKPVRVVAERVGVSRRDHPCLGQFITSLALYYRSAADFHGSDRMRVRVRFPPTSPQEETVIREEEIFITVR